VRFFHVAAMSAGVLGASLLFATPAWAGGDCDSYAACSEAPHPPLVGVHACVDASVGNVVGVDLSCPRHHKVVPVVPVVPATPVGVPAIPVVPVPPKVGVPVPCDCATPPPPCPPTTASAPPVVYTPPPPVYVPAPERTIYVPAPARYAAAPAPVVVQSSPEQPVPVVTH
jgi:hypothetical protein